MNVAVIGYSGELDDKKISSIKDICINTGKAIADAGHTLWSGGRNGVMELASRGAKENGGNILGVLPWEPGNHNSVPNKYVDFPIFTGMDFATRSFVLLKNVDLVISIGGGSGTAIEIFAAYSYGKKMVFFENTGGWTDKIIELHMGQKQPFYLDYRNSAPSYTVKTIEELKEYL